MSVNECPSARSCSRTAAIQRADGGTLFLDELGAVSPTVQSRLLRVLEAKTVKPVGADQERSVDVRVLAATPVDLATRVASGDFRADLFYRLSSRRWWPRGRLGDERAQARCRRDCPWAMWSLPTPAPVAAAPSSGLQSARRHAGA